MQIPSRFIKHFSLKWGGGIMIFFFFFGYVQGATLCPWMFLKVTLFQLLLVLSLPKVQNMYRKRKVIFLAF